jgi:hypothetical protein
MSLIEVMIGFLFFLALISILIGVSLGWAICNFCRPTYTYTLDRRDYQRRKQRDRNENR